MQIKTPFNKFPFYKLHGDHDEDPRIVVKQQLAKFDQKSHFKHIELIFSFYLLAISNLITLFHEELY